MFNRGEPLSSPLFHALTLSFHNGNMIVFRGQPRNSRPMTSLKPVDFKAVAAKGCFVYCYLRTDGTPYYIGIANNAGRPLRVSRNTVQNTVRPIPGRPELIRLMRSELTWEEAGQWEKFYIAHYGRKDLGTGILRNRTAGGDGCVNHGPEALRKMRTAFRKANKISTANLLASSAARYGVSVEFWSSLNTEERQKICMRYRAGVRGAEIFDNDRNFGLEKAVETKAIKSAKKYGCSVEQWKSFGAKHRTAICTRFIRGVRGDALIAPVVNKEEVSSRKYGVSFADWCSLPRNVREAIAARFRRGKRGADLVAGLVAA